jgi:hypothetical protein
MIRICYSKFHTGDRKFGEKEPFEDRRETHGVCNDCFPLEKEDIRKAMKEYRRLISDQSSRETRDQ